ncbi:MAG: YbjQ family protein [Anaerolineales bacterium]|nr:YbjQ family protein [Anaerolineales bacterium]
MSKDESIEAFITRMSKESTQYLRRIIEADDKDDWTEEELEEIKEILTSRGEELPKSGSEILDGLFVSTTDIVQGIKIMQYLGIVSSVVVLGTGVLSEFGAGIADLLGTRAGRFQSKLEHAREIALEEMGEKAIHLGGDGIIGIDFDYLSLSNNVLMVSANGTAVKLDPEEID